MKKRRAIWLSASIMVAAAGALWLAARSPAQTALGAYKAELIAQGEKLDKESWLPPPGRGSNGAALLVATLAQYSMASMVSGISQYDLITNDHAKVVWRYDSKEPQGRNPPLDVWRAIDETVRTNQVLYSNIMQAVHAGYTDVPYDYVAERFPMAVANTPWLTMSPYPSFLNIRVVMPLSAHVCLRLRQNRPEEAGDELAALMELAQNTSCEPNLTSLKARAEIVDELCQTTWQFLQYTNLPESRLHALQKAWEDLDILPMVEPAFALRRACVEDHYEAMRRKLSLWQKPPKELFRILAGLITDFNATKKTLHQNALLTRQSYTDEVTKYRDAQAELEAARLFCRAQAGAAALDKKSPHEDVIEAVVLAETQRQMTIAALALQRYHLANGRYPETLSELQPAFLKEPPVGFVDGKPLRYKPADDGTFLLYSVGVASRGDGSVAQQSRRQVHRVFPESKNGQEMVWPQPATDAEVAASMAALQNPRQRLTPR